MACPLPTRRRSASAGRIAWRCCLAATIIAVVLAACIVLIVGYLAHAPIVINGLGTRIESALHDRFGHGTVFSVGSTALVQRGFGPTLGINGLSVEGPDHQKILSAPIAEVSVDALSLLVGNVVPRRLEVFDVELRLVLLKNGNLAVAAGRGEKPFFELSRGDDDPAPAPVSGAPAASTPAVTSAPSVAETQPPVLPAAGAANPLVAPRRAAAMRQAATGIRMLLDSITAPDSPIAAIDRLGIKRGRLVIEDQTTGEEVVYKDLDLEFDKPQGETTLTLSAEGPSQRWSVRAKANGTPGAARHVQIAVKNLSMDEFQLALGSRTPGFDTDIPVSMTFKIGLNANDTLSEAVATFDAGEGFFRLEDPDHEPELIQKISGGAHWNGETRHIEIDRTEIVEGTSRFVLGGSILPPLNEGEPWTIAMATSEPGVFGPDRLGDQPVVIDRGQLSARVFPDQKKFVIDRFAVGSGKEGALALAGQVEWENGPHVRFGASIDPTSVRIVKRVWPNFVAAPVRAWILDHFEDGIFKSGKMQIDYDADALLRMRSDRAPPDASVSMDFVLSKARVAFLPGVPPLEDAEGIGHVSGRTSRFTLTSAVMQTGGRKLALSDGTFFVPNADVHPAPASISARVSASVEAVADLLSRDALRPYASLPLDPATLKGQVDGRIDDGLLLGEHAQHQDNNLRINATISNFSAEKLIGKEKLDNATLTVAVDPAGMKATGQGRIFGGPATFEIAKSGERAPDAVINVTLDDAARAKLGVAVIPGVTGPMNARIAASGLGQPQKMKAQVELDLSRMGVTAGFFGLTKPAGKPAKVTFSITPGEKQTTIDPLVLDIGSLQARGALEFGPDNTFQSGRFSSVRISPGDDMKVDVSRGEETFKLTIRGSTIDARPFLKALTQMPSANDNAPLAKNAKAERKEAEAFKGFDVDLKSGILTGFNKEVMSDVDLRLSKRGSQVRQFSVQGKFGRSTLIGSLTPNQRMRVSTQDAGALVSFIDLYKHMEGGLLNTTMLVGDETLDGNMEIQNFILRDEPAMKKLVAQSVTSSQLGDSASTAARSVNANAVAFTKLKVNFQRAGSRLELKDATMYGSAIGLSVDGWLDYAHDRVGMNGTFVPAFAVNNLFSQVPVIGFFLGGGSNEGLFAITFRITGLASSPTMSVNPLSAIAPGFLRKIFGALDPNGKGGDPSFPQPASR